jgi:hypothetical protein
LFDCNLDNGSHCVPCTTQMVLLLLSVPLLQCKTIFMRPNLITSLPPDNPAGHHHLCLEPCAQQLFCRGKLPVTTGARLPLPFASPPSSPGSRAASVNDAHKKQTTLTVGTKRPAQDQEAGATEASGPENQPKPGIRASGAPGVNSLASLGKKKAKTSSGSAAPSLGPRLPTSGACGPSAGGSKKAPTPSATVASSGQPSDSRDGSNDSGEVEVAVVPSAAGAKSKAPQGGSDARGDSAKRPRIPGSTDSAALPPNPAAKTTSGPSLAVFKKGDASGSGAAAGDNTTKAGTGAKGAKATTASAKPSQGRQQASIASFFKGKSLVGKEPEPGRSMLPPRKPAASPSVAETNPAAAADSGGEPGAGQSPSKPAGAGSKPMLSLQKGLQATLSPPPAAGAGGLTGSSSRANTAANGKTQAPAPGSKQQSAGPRVPAPSSAAAGSSNGGGGKGGAATSSKATSGKAGTSAGGGGGSKKQGSKTQALPAAAPKSPSNKGSKKAGGDSEIGSPGKPIEISDSDE